VRSCAENAVQKKRRQDFSSFSKKNFLAGVLPFIEAGEKLLGVKRQFAAGDTPALQQRITEN
jgi:hypothetical protein